MRDGLHLICAAILWVAASANAQDSGFSLQEVERLHVDDAEAGVDGERIVEVYLRALSQHADPVDDLRPAHLDVRDNGERVDPEDVSVQHLGRARKGITWVIAIDASRTMLGDAFEQAKAAAIELLDRIGHHDRLAIVTFAQTVDVVSRFEDTPNDARNRLEVLEVDEAGLKTLLVDGLHESLELIRGETNRPRRAAIILFSDGKDSGSDHTLGEVVERASADKVLVYTIGYDRFGGDGLGNLAFVAEETDAESMTVDEATDLVRFFNEIGDRLLRSYVVRFPASMDGEPHMIEVSVDEQSDSIKLTYPEIAAPVWPWLTGGAIAAFVVLVLIVALRFRSAGRLVFVDGPRGGEVHDLQRGRLRIGAVDANDLVIPSMAVSRYHAEVFVSGTKVEIKDLHSSNGTHINGQRVQAAPLRLHPGDRIQIADVEMVYER
ncbi:MAG: FHA domain-containing protein [Myxococcota bacterium]